VGVIGKYVKIMKIEHLDWDSNFFGKKIGKIFCQENNIITADFIELLMQAKNEKYNLIYCFGNKNFYLSEDILSEFKGDMVDRKVIYKGSIKEPLQETFLVEEFYEDKINEDLEDLAFQSGEYSRFQIEPYFTLNDFHKLYREWLVNSLNKKIADKTYVIKKHHNILGIITISIQNKIGTIGLLAIDKNAQGKGYGSQLINAVKRMLIQKNISVIEVATQVYNKQACAFYEKNGLSIKSINNIYHISLK